MVQAVTGVKAAGVAGGCDTYADRGCDRFVNAAGWVPVDAIVPCTTPLGCVSGVGTIVDVDKGL